MTIEIEKRFLLRVIPAWAQSQNWKLLRQGYLSVDAHQEIRVRDENGAFSMTVKQGEGVARQEVEIPLNSDQFFALWSLTAARRLEKRRCELPLSDGCTLFIDEYLSPAQFLLAEVEFATQSLADTFIAPGYLGPEVTDIATIRNMPALLARIHAWKKEGQSAG